MKDKESNKRRDFIRTAGGFGLFAAFMAAGPLRLLARKKNKKVEKREISVSVHPLAVKRSIRK